MYMYACFAYTQLVVITIEVSSENPIATHPVVTADTVKSIMSPLTVHCTDQSRLPLAVAT